MSNYPTLDGLNNIDADSGNLTNITCETFIATSSAQVPTVVAGSSDNNAASTEFVTDAITNAPYVTLNTTQILTSGIKQFTNLPQSSATPSNNQDLTTKLYVDNAITAGGGAFVTLSTAQTVTGNKSFTGTTILGDIIAADQPCKVSIMNNSVNDTSVNGSISGEAIFNQVRFGGGRGFYIAQGTDSNNQYFAMSGSGSPDPDCYLTIKRDAGLKISNGTDTSTFTEQLKVVGTSRFTGVGTFEVSPVCAATVTTANQLIPKSYADNNFLALTGSQTVTGNKTFFPTTGTTIIRGSQADIFPDVCFLTGNTTTISGVNCNITSTTNFIAGTTTNIATTTLNVQNTCGNFNVNATNTNLTGTNATCSTQLASDNSTKIASTAYVNAHVSGLYMTLATNQNVSGIKTYSTKQVFNAGTECSTYDNTSLTDMSIANNSQQGILTIAGGRLLTDTFGARVGVGGNLQLNSGAFIEPNLSYGAGREPVFTFGTNQSTGYVDIPAVPRSAQATRRIDTGLIGFFCGNNETTTFTISHSIVTTSLAGIASMEEAEVYFYFQDNNTSIIRYTTGNLATTTSFTLLPNSTYVRPTITFTLTTNTLPEGSYKIYGYSRVTNAYSLNAGILSVNWNLSSPVSSISTLQNYNTAIDFTFTSRNVYHCFRNYVAGVYIINNIAVAQNIMLPIFYSVTDLTNIMFQPTTSGAVPTTDGGAFSGQTGVGNYNVLGCDNKDNYWLVYPNYGLIVYNSAGWTGTVYLNYRNKTNNPVVVAGTTIQGATSVKVFFDSVELIKY